MEDLWGVLKQEIDDHRPLVASVDATSDGIATPNHSVPVLAYWEKPDGNCYGFYDNWGEEETIRWEKFAAPTADVGWAVAALYAIAPEPASPIAFDPGMFDLALIA